jgi:hypothetical protein
MSMTYGESGVGGGGHELHNTIYVCLLFDQHHIHISNIGIEY